VDEDLPVALERHERQPELADHALDPGEEFLASVATVQVRDRSISSS
jgi:hypothetical protein